MTSPLTAALADAAKRGWPVFPCQWRGERRKQPLVKDWDEFASKDPAVIGSWWERWPNALVGMPTGIPSGRYVLDVDVKNARANGFDTLCDLGFPILPVTPMAHTESGGLHLHLDPGEHLIRNTAGKKGRGIGPGLDWRGEGGYVIVPSDGSGYWWDPVCGPDTPLAAVPAELLPRRLGLGAKFGVLIEDALSHGAGAAGLDRMPG